MKKEFVLTILAVFLLLEGCTGATTSKSKDIDVRNGFEGLKMEFLKNTPPQKVFERESFPIMIQVKNNGAYSIKTDEGAVLALGVEKDYTKKIKLMEGGRISSGGKENIAIFNLDGRSSINPKGDEDIISYNLEAGTIDPQSETHPSTVVATLCYPYETELDASVCIDPDISNTNLGKKVCKVQDLVFNSGQGGPVSVTKIEASTIPVIETGKEKPRIKAQFLIFIENRGQGTVVNRDVINKFCTSSEISHENLNVVYIKAFLSDNKEMNCELKKEKDGISQRFVKLQDKKEIVRCSLEKGLPDSQDAYISPLKIVLSYGYSNSVSANYAIQKIAR